MPNYAVGTPPFPVLFFLHSFFPHHCFSFNLMLLQIKQSMNVRQKVYIEKRGFEKKRWIQYISLDPNQIYEGNIFLEKYLLEEEKRRSNLNQQK